MVRSSRKENQAVKKGAWAPEEDRKLIAYVNRYGIWNWSQMPKFAGLSRSGKSCRLRWLNYLNPDVKRGNFTEKEVEIIISMYQKFGSRWSLIAKKLPGRTDNEIKNYWHTRLKNVLSKNNLKPSVHDESPALVAAEIPSSLAEAIQENAHDEIKPSLPFPQVSILEGYYQEADDTSSTTTTTTPGWDFSADSDDERRYRQLETAFAEMNIGDDTREINNIPSSRTQDFMLENYLCMEQEEQQQIGYLHSEFDFPSWSLLVDPLSPSSCFYNDVYCDILFNFPEKRGTTDFEEPYFWL